MLTRQNPLQTMVLGKIVAVSIAAFFSQLLVFDEADWYRIDRYDAMVWAFVVTQVFALATYVSQRRAISVDQSLKVFYCIAGLAAGLTIAAMFFLIIEAVQNGRRVDSLLPILPGYWTAVFVFLVSMYLHLRLAIICLRPLASLFRKTETSEPKEGEPSQRAHFSMMDIFAFTGLAAVSISSYRLVLGMLTGYDAIRYLAMFYAASVTAFCVYGITLFPRSKNYLKMGVIGMVIVIIAFAEFWIALQLRTRFQRLGIVGNSMFAIVVQIALWNAFVAGATWIQLRMLSKPNSNASNPLQ